MKLGLKSGSVVIALAALAVTAGPALARSKHRVPPQCIDRPMKFSWVEFLFGGGPDRHPNGCAPPVFSNGDFIGQDPDPFIRFGLRHDPNSGYTDNSNP